jgi:hypothetical protein
VRFGEFRLRVKSFAESRLRPSGILSGQEVEASGDEFGNLRRRLGDRAGLPLFKNAAKSLAAGNEQECRQTQHSPGATTPGANSGWVKEEH